MLSLIKIFIPPQKWKTPVIIILGICTGLIIYLVHISKVFSYAGDDPATCVNCHIMAPQYATWSHSSHREVAVCNDCHVPHENIARKYFFKGMDGMRHSAIFTMRKEPQVIFIHEAGRKVVQNNCIRCHVKLLTDAKLNRITNHYQTERESRKCWDCHREVPHGRVNSLASVPGARVPLPGSPVPAWLKKSLQKK